MNKKVNIAVISHALVIPVFQNRWRKLSQDKNYNINLIIPKYWEQRWFGEKVVYEQKEEHSDNFHIYPFATTSVKNWGKYLLKSFDAKFKKIKPDIIYIIHEESILIHHQIYLYRKLWAPKAKVIFFSMNARGVPSKRFYHKLMWNNIKKNTDAALVHYPGCLKSLRDGNYKKPIFIQTQVGVDENLFKPSKNAGNIYREKINFKNKLILGYVGRINEDKGVDDIFEVFIELSKEIKNLVLLLVGNGDLREEIERNSRINHLEDRVHITGFVDQAEVPNYMNSMDILILGSKTKKHWIDTFPLATVQAQACGLPVIATNSGAIPWQLSNTALIYKEGDRLDLKQKINLYINEEKLREEYAAKGRKRTLENFCHKNMNENFKKIIENTLKNNFIYHEKHEKYIQWKAY